MKSFSSSPQPVGKRLLPRVVDELAEMQPERLFGKYTNGNNSYADFINITMRELATAVNHMAWWIKETLGTTTEFEPVAYLGAADFRYTIVILAAIKCGIKILLPGTRFPGTELKRLFERTNCRKLIYSIELEDELKRFDVEVRVRIQTLEELLSSEATIFPYNKAFEQAIDDPILMIHSSGTTGDPKLVTMTHGTLSVTDSDRFMPCPVGRKPQNGVMFDFKDGGGFYSCFPPYHLAGIQAFLILPIFSTSASIVVGPPSAPPTGNLLSSIIAVQKGFIRAIYVPPSIIEQWSSNEQYLEQSASLEFILFGGGPLPQAIGKELSQRTRVCQMYGSVEIGQVQLLLQENAQDGWDWMEFNPYEAADMQHRSDGLHELVLHQEYRLRDHRSLYHNFRERKEWRSGDLFVAHPSVTGLWRYHGRIDNLVVLANGHKVNPYEFELAFRKYPEVTGVILFGNGRSEPALLLEIVVGAQTSKTLHQDIWTRTIQEVNSRMPQYGRVSKSKVLFSTLKKPFVRSPKGSIVRKATLELYASEIDELFSAIPEISIVSLGSLRDVLGWIHEGLRRIFPDQSFRDDDDLFLSGMDSVRAAGYIAILKQSLRKMGYPDNPISIELLYKNPTPSKIASVIFSMSALEDSPTFGDGPSMEDIIAEHTRNILDSSPMCALVSGGTGNLGTRVIDHLLRITSVRIVFVLVRKSISKERLEQFSHYFHSRHLDSLDRVIYIKSDASEDHYGIQPADYARVVSSVSVVIHLAWEVDFNLTLQTFNNSHIRGLRSIIDLCLTSRRQPRLVFASSTAYAISRSMQKRQGVVLETFLPSEDNTPVSDYGKSKQIAERMLEVVQQRTRTLPLTILRFGHLSMPVNEQNSLHRQSDWVQCMTMTSRSLGLIPQADLLIDWVPIDQAAAVVSELIFGKIGSTAEVYNIVHPKPVHWNVIVQALKEALPEAQTVPLATWIDATISESGRDQESLARFPALKLIPFMRQLLWTERHHRNTGIRVSVTKAMHDSRTMRELQPFDKDNILK